jgi:hypothetical protein
MERSIAYTVRERAATEGASRKALDVEAEKLTNDQCAAIHTALKMLAGMCDGARTWDGSGFSKIDVAIGHSLAEQLVLTRRQCALGLKLVRKYRRQLGDDIMSKIGGAE